MSRRRNVPNHGDPRQTARSMLGLAGSQVTPQQIEEALAKAAIAVEDAARERDHWRAAFGGIQTELKFLLATVLRRTGDTRLVVTLKDLQELQAGKDVYVGNPEPGVRVYELRPKAERPMIERPN